MLPNLTRMKLPMLTTCLFWLATKVQSQPSPLPVKPLNDRCATAQPVTVGTTIVGDLANATVNQRGIDLPANTTCRHTEWEAFIDAPGLWYSFVGTGGPVAVELALLVGILDKNRLLDFPHFAVYKGEASCDSMAAINSLQCVTAFIMTPTRPTTFVFATESSAVTYHMFVSSSIYNQSRVNKQTTVAFVTRMATASSQLVANDDCTNALPIAVGTQTTGSTSLATSDEPNVSTNCPISRSGFNAQVSYRRPGVWYKILGTGRRVDVTTTAAMIVYKGANCADATRQTCFVGSGVLRSRVSFYTVLNVNYYLLLWTDNPFFQDFSLRVDEFPPFYALGNDLCSKARPVQLGVQFPGSFTGAVYQIDMPVPTECGGERLPGMWYSFSGFNGVVTPVMTCRSSDDAWRGHLTIHVYTGSCLARQCEDSIIMYPCDPAPFSIAVKTGVTYYMLVQSPVYEDYNFNMTLIPTAAAANDVCVKATPLTLGTTLTRNNFTAASSDEKEVTDDCSCGTVKKVARRSLWFSFVGTGTKLWADVCGGSTPQFKKQVSIYKGASCRSLMCVAGRTIPCPIGDIVPEVFLFDTEVGTTYYMLVQNRQETFTNGQLTSVFDVAVKAAPVPPVNDVCSTATLTSVGSTVTGDLTLAASDHEEMRTVCSNYQRESIDLPVEPFVPGVWYRFAGTGGNVRVTSNCDPGYSTTNIHVYKGTMASSSCSSLQCVTGFHNYCFVGDGNDKFINAFNFTTDVGNTYYLLVRKSVIYNSSTTSRFEVQLEPAVTGPFNKFPTTPVVPKRCIAIPPTPVAAPIIASAPVAVPVIPPTPVAVPIIALTPVAVPVIPPTPVAVPVPPPSTSTSPQSPMGQDPSLGKGPLPVPAVPAPAAVSRMPQSPQSAPVQPTRCQSLGCRIRRLFRAIFGGQ